MKHILNSYKRLPISIKIIEYCVFITFELVFVFDKNNKNTFEK